LQSVPSGLSQLKYHAPAVGQNHVSLKIRSSRAFDPREHSNLHDIVEKLDRVASMKRKRDLLKVSPLAGGGRGSNTKAARGGEKPKASGEEGSPEGGFAEAQREEIARKRKQAEARAQTDRKIYEALGLPHQQS
jgi:hypothetical protein